MYEIYSYNHCQLLSIDKLRNQLKEESGFIIVATVFESAGQEDLVSDEDLEATKFHNLKPKEGTSNQSYKSMCTVNNNDIDGMKIKTTAITTPAGLIITLMTSQMRKRIILKKIERIVS